MNQEKLSVQGSQQRDPDPQSHLHQGHEHMMHHPQFHTQSHPQAHHFVHHHHHYHYHHMMSTSQR